MNKRILSLAIPNIITNITVPLLGIVDIAIVGRLGNESYIGAASLGTMIFNFIYWNFGFLRMGTSGFTAQALGARNLQESTKILVRAACIGLLSGLLILLLQKPIANCAFYFIEGSQSTEWLAYRYFSIRIWASPAVLLLYGIKGWFIGMQNSKLPMIAAIVINVLNVLLCLFFVYVCHMDIEGVALGTVLSQYAGLLLMLIFWWVYYKKLWKYVNIKQSLRFKEMLAFFKVNTDIFLRTTCLIAVFTFIPIVSAKMGDNVLAVNTLLMQFFTLFSYIMDGFAYAGEALVGKYVGAKNALQLKQSVRLLFRWGVLLSALFVAIYACFGTQILQIFTDKPQIVEYSKTYFYWILLVPFAGFGAFLWDGIYIGATSSKAMRNSMFVATAVFFAIYYLFANSFGNNALWISFILYLLFRGLMMWFYSPKAVYGKVK